VERRLTGWRPGAEGLDADAMLFAAGLAAGRSGRGRLLWPALCVVLAVQAAGLGVWGLAERAECQALAERLRDRTPTPGTPPATDVAVVPETPDEASPADYLSTRRRLEQDPNGWLASLQPAGPQDPGPPPPEPALLTPRQRDGLFEE
jgi:hypothetical protein